MVNYISDINVSTNLAEEQELGKKGFQKLSVSLNKGSGANDIFLWYKISDKEPITRIQFSFPPMNEDGLNSEGYNKVERNLNPLGPRGIYLWFFKGTSEYDVPIVELEVTCDARSDAKKLKPEWERSACDLNQDGAGRQIHLWMKRESQTYICDVKVSDKSTEDQQWFRQGFIRVDKDTNSGVAWPLVFMWYRQTTDKTKAIRELKVSTNSGEEKRYEKQFFQKVEPSMNAHTRGNDVFLWYKNDEESKEPIKLVTLLNNNDAIEEFKKAGAIVKDQKNLNPGHCGNPIFFSYYY